MKISKALMKNKLALVLAFSMLGIGFSTAVAISYSAANHTANDAAFVVPENLDLEEMAKFTSSDKARAVEIFLANSDVQEKINGQTYRIIGTGVGTPDLSAKPPKFNITVYIRLGNDKVVAGAVDLQNEAVISVKESFSSKLG